MHKLLISSHLLTSFIFIFHLYFLLLPSVNVLFLISFVLIYLLKLGGEQLWNNLIFCTVTKEMLLSTKVQCDFYECDFTPCGLCVITRNTEVF